MNATTEAPTINMPPEDEPDGAEWTDPATGLKCLIKRNSMGAFCGYVRVPHSNLRKRLTKFRRTLIGRGKWRHVAYDHSAVRRIQVHGGLTWAGRFGGRNKGYWLGFDCAHWNDIVPGMVTFEAKLGLRCQTGTYRNFAYVTCECEHLAAQLKKILDKEKK